MKRERLKRIKRHQKRGFVYKPRGFIHRSKRLVDHLRDLPVEKLPPIRHFVHRMLIQEYDDDPNLHAISFMTERGTVILTCNSAMLLKFYRQLRDDFKIDAEPKQELVVARYQQRRERAA